RRPEKLVEEGGVARLGLAERDAERDHLAAALAHERVLDRALLHLEAGHLADGLAVVGAADGWRRAGLAELDRVIAPGQRRHDEGAKDCADGYEPLHGSGH